MEGGYYLDVLKVHAAELAKRLAFYKLRAKVIVEDLSGKLAVVAGWDSPVPSEGFRLGLGRPASTRTWVAGDRRRRGDIRIRDRSAETLITPGASALACRREAVISCLAMPFPTRR